ncbi:fimbria/pilus chaperone family protein [Burkholderia territorii]|uniref:fimbria/pilus chaperone family protein n=1 Tax=Burkholderia territorii TaxID=1503055 RepID=UPI00084128AD|nr:fimbria/pilus chaperone family protein [Burkholderia territorii]
MKAKVTLLKQTYLLSLVLCAMAVGSTFSPTLAEAGTFTLESTTVVLPEQDSRVSFNVKNDGQSPMLLVTKLDDLDDRGFAGRVLVTPPLTRIDPGQSQQVNFVLKKGERLEREIMLKASFEGVTQQSELSSMVFPVRQEIALLIQPATVPKVNNPWSDLKVSASASELVLHNPGKHVIRLGRSLTLMPGREAVNLDAAYILPGSTKRLRIGSRPTAVVILPLSRFGYTLDAVELPVGTSE